MKKQVANRKKQVANSMQYPLRAEWVSARESGSVAVITLVLVLGLFAAAAYAQSVKRIEVNVPFEFVAGDETLPPGDYALEQVFSGVLSVREIDGRASAMVMVLSDRDRPPREGSKLVFTRYGERYFLSRIWPAAGAAERELAKSREELQIIGSGAKPNLAFVRFD